MCTRHRDVLLERFALPYATYSWRRGKEGCLRLSLNWSLYFCLSFSMACLPCLRPPLFLHVKFDFNNGLMKGMPKLLLHWKWRMLLIGSSQPFNLGLPSSASSRELLVVQRLPRHSRCIYLP